MPSKPSYTTSDTPTRGIGQAVDEMMTAAKNTRRGHERRWYDNNFFDDGYHFRYVSRQENKIVDWSEKTNLYNPLRAIPKASRQIRGIVNLLISRDLIPLVYPEKVEKANYPDEVMYQAALKEAELIARKTGHWLTEEFKNQSIKELLAYMGILSAKHSISYLQVWPDAINEKIKTQIFDAFDIYTLGQYLELEDVPFIIKATPRLIAEIKADDNFDKDQLELISPDNRQASSEIKEAYMSSRYGGRPTSDKAATLIQKEAFIKEYLNEDNVSVIKKQEDGGDILKKREYGDPVIRHTFVAGNIWLKDEYLDLTTYPFVDFRYEPGPLYQTPLIERFIPSNKSLDMIVSRVERWAHQMGVGVWLKKQTEQFDINNKAGGQIINYKTTPPRQAEMANLPPTFWNYIGLLNSFMEEQGVSTTTLGKLPAGVKGYQAIESMKESEYANLVTANQRLMQTVKRIAQKFVDIADDYFVTPQSYAYLEKGEPQYFDVIGKNALKKREEVKLETPTNITPISKEYRVEIQVESGLGYTEEGKKASAKEFGDYLIQLAQLGLLPPQVMTEYLQQLFKLYHFGTSSEIMKDIEAFGNEGMMSDPQMEKMKVALAEVIKDTGIAEKEDTTDDDIKKNKVAVAEVLKDIQGGQK